MEALNTALADDSMGFDSPAPQTPTSARQVTILSKECALREHLWSAASPSPLSPSQRETDTFPLSPGLSRTSPRPLLGHFFFVVVMFTELIFV